MKYIGLFLIPPVALTLAVCAMYGALHVAFGQSAPTTPPAASCPPCPPCQGFGETPPVPLMVAAHEPPPGWHLVTDEQYRRAVAAEAASVQLLQIRTTLERLAAEPKK